MTSPKTLLATANGTRRSRSRPITWLVAVVALLAMLLVGASAARVVPAAAAEPTTLPYTDDACGGEGQAPCGFFTEYWHSNGNRGCDRGLKESDGACINGNEPQARRSGRIDNYVGSWEEWALDNQSRQLAAGEPFNWVTTLGAHNGFSSTADGYSDPNQEYSLTDQLRGSVRWLDLDVYWHSGQLRLCHGECSLTDRHYTNAIKEIGAWLDGNPGEVIMISFEDKITGAPDTLHERLHNPIQLYLDQSKTRTGAQRVYKPGDQDTVCRDDSCADGRWPSRRELLAAGKQVVIFSENTRDGRYLWPTSETNGYPNSGVNKIDIDGCAVKATGAALWQAHLTRWSVAGEDRTQGGSFVEGPERPGLIDNPRAAKLARCNVTKLTLDHAHSADKTAIRACNAGKVYDGLTDPCPNPDLRIRNTIWSWAEDDRGQFGDRALLGVGRRWVSDRGDQNHHFACARPRSGPPASWPDPKGAEWRITKATGPWPAGFAACVTEFPGSGTEFPGFVFSAPVNGWQNEQLLEKIGESGIAVYLNYLRRGPVGTDWTVPERPTKTIVSPATVVYDGTPRAARVYVEDSAGTVVPATPIVSYSGRGETTYGPTSTPPTAAGGYTVSDALFPGNEYYQPSYYKPSSNNGGTFTITTRPLSVKAHDKIRHVNTANPPLTGTLTGLVAGDAITAVYRTEAVPSSPPGNYPIRPDELKDPNAKLANYDVTAKRKGTLRVVVPVTISAPSDGQVIELGSSVRTRYACSPLIVVCSGPVPNGAPIDTKTVGEKKFTVTGFDSRWFPFSASVRYIVRDTPPTVSIRTPPEGATYAVGQGVRAAYTCTDPALTHCVGTVAKEAFIDTASLGVKTFTVTGIDATGNRATVTHRYRVAPTAGGGVAATSGDHQRAASGSAFADPLVATVSNGSGRRLQGAPVQFTVGGPAAFPGGASSVSVTTNRRGVATSPPLTAGPLPGQTPFFPVVVVASSDAVSGVRAAVYNLTVTRP